ncbi:hypothetical protein Tco_0801739, partial [Tanacetum coccineum]
MGNRTEIYDVLVKSPHIQNAKIVIRPIASSVNCSIVMPSEGTLDLRDLVLHVNTPPDKAAGKNGIPVRLHGYEYGRASGMAPYASYYCNVVHQEDVAGEDSFYLLESVLAYLCCTT